MTEWSGGLDLDELARAIDAFDVRAAVEIVRDEDVVTACYFWFARRHVILIAPGKTAAGANASILHELEHAAQTERGWTLSERSDDAWGMAERGAISAVDAAFKVATDSPFADAPLERRLKALGLLDQYLAAV